MITNPKGLATDCQTSATLTLVVKNKNIDAVVSLLLLISLWKDKATVQTIFFFKRWMKCTLHDEWMNEKKNGENKKIVIINNSLAQSGSYFSLFFFPVSGKRFFIQVLLPSVSICLADIHIHIFNDQLVNSPAPHRVINSTI